MTRVFVYGTLKEGFRNFAANRGRRVPGEFVTVQPYPLYVLGEFGLPWLVHRPGEGLPVHGQVFEVDDEGLAALEVLERTRDADWYTRRPLFVRCLADGRSLDAQAYFGSETRLSQWTVHAGPIAEYTVELQALYRRHL